MTGNTEFDRPRRYKNSYTTCNAMYFYMLPLLSLICFVKKHWRAAYLRVEKHVQNTDKHLIWNFFRKYLMALMTPKKLHLRRFTEF